jgi:hypothetical protein
MLVGCALRSFGAGGSYLSEAEGLCELLGAFAVYLMLMSSYDHTVEGMFERLFPGS